MSQLKSYIPFNEQEKQDKQLIIDQLANAKDIFTRKNKLAHFTVSAWIISHDKNEVLMAYHNIYQSWSWLGGHADGNSNLKQVILKEIQEESGLTDAKFLSDDIFSLEVLTVDGWTRKTWRICLTLLTYSKLILLCHCASSLMKIVKSLGLICLA